MIIHDLNKKALFFFLIIEGTNAQTHFVFKANMGNNATVAIPLSVHLEVNGTLLSDGKEVRSLVNEVVSSGHHVVIFNAVYLALRILSVLWAKKNLKLQKSLCPSADKIWLN